MNISIPHVKSLEEGKKKAGKRRIFIKQNGIHMIDLFEAEAIGLWALKQQKHMRVPDVICVGVDAGREISFIMTELIEQTPQGFDYWEEFGHSLALLHKEDASKFAEHGRFGFLHDNYIGLTPQYNNNTDSWPEFFRDFRLRPQIEMAAEYLQGDLMKKAERLLSIIEDFIPDDFTPSLLHGDLWNGNAICGPEGKAYLIDPATYVGHFEADIAMTQMFGGFSQFFYDAYCEIIPLELEYFEERRYIYNLYHYLNHVNIFGEGYMTGVEGILKKF